MNWIDNIIEIISPEAAYKREAWRVAKRGFYDASSGGRLQKGWKSIPQNAELGNQSQRQDILGKAQDLERNSDTINSIIRAFIRNEVGKGFLLQCRAKDEKGNLLDTLNKNTEELFREWCKPENCDVSGRLSFSQICRMIVRRKKVDGGLIILKVYTDGGILPFKLQVREINDIDNLFNTYQLSNGTQIINGIEVNEYNKHIAYHFKKLDPLGNYTGLSERVTADRVCYCVDLMRPSQIREVSEIACTMPRVAQVESYLEAETVKARINACMAAFIKKVSAPGMVNGVPSFGRGNDSGTTDTGSGYGGTSIAPGMIYELNQGEEMGTINPPNSAGQARDFIGIQQAMSGSGMGLSYEAASRDLSRTNYGSLRQGRLEDGAEYEIGIDDLTSQFLDVVFTWFYDAGVLTGLIPLKYSDFVNNKIRYQAHDFIAKGMTWIDPLKETRANQIALDPRAPQTTLAAICRGQGQDESDVIRQRAIETALLYTEYKKVLTPDEYNHFLGVIPNGNKPDSTQTTA